MKLTELDPRWWADGDGRHGMGITFNCPGGCCAAGPPVRLGVAFANPIDGGPPEHLVPHHDEVGHVAFSSAPEWTRVGENFELLSLSPSVNAAAAGHWHGFITNGDAR